ncbi:MAG: carboxypeptidase regulatory-like domain-containing protein [Acidobacteriaceae bacterium]
MKYSISVVLVAFSLAVGAHAGTLYGKVSGGKGKSVVYIDAIAGKSFPAPARHAVMNQVYMRFAPHLLVVQQGTTVDFLNTDKMEHNIFWISVGGNEMLSHDLGTWPQGQKRSFKFDNPGEVRLHCFVHPDMAAYIFVSPTPYFAKTDGSGKYRIENIPDGKYTVKVWNEKVPKTHSIQVTVSGGTNTDVNLTD